MKTQTLIEPSFVIPTTPDPGQPRRQVPSSRRQPAIVLALLALLAVLGAPGCATITRGTTDQLAKEGYQDVTVKVNPEVGGGGAAGLAGNVLIGGVVGAIIDPASGAIYDLKPNPVSVKLVPSPSADGARAGGPATLAPVTARF